MYKFRNEKNIGKLALCQLKPHLNESCAFHTLALVGLYIYQGCPKMSPGSLETHPQSGPESPRTLFWPLRALGLRLGRKIVLFVVSTTHSAERTPKSWNSRLRIFSLGHWKVDLLVQSLLKER